MKTITVRLPEVLVTEIKAESRARQVPKSDVVRERLTSAPAQPPTSFEAIADLAGSVDGLQADISANVKRYLKATGYGRQRSR